MSKIKFHHLKPTPGSTKSKIRKGRGEARKKRKNCWKRDKRNRSKKNSTCIL